MSDSREDETLFFMDPDPRGVLPLDGLHISRSLQKFVRKSNWRVKFNSDFASVISECAQIDPDKNRHETWISRPIEELYKFLNENGHAFSVEVYQTCARVNTLSIISHFPSFCLCLTCGRA